MIHRNPSSNPSLKQPAPVASQSPYVIMQFGRAQLLETPTGRLIVRGGTKSDHVEVKEYVSLFMHDVAISFEA